MKLHWKCLGTTRADDAHGKRVEIAGWPTTLLPVATASHFLLTCEPSCCAGCVPANPLAVIEVSAERPIELAAGALRLAGTLHVQHDDPEGWRYQLKDARLVSA